MGRWLGLINSITFRSAEILKNLIEETSEGLIEADNQTSGFYVTEKEGVKVTSLAIRVNSKKASCQPSKNVSKLPKYEDIMKAIGKI